MDELAQALRDAMNAIDHAHRLARPLPITDPTRVALGAAQIEIHNARRRLEQRRVDEDVERVVHRPVMDERPAIAAREH